MKTSLRGILSLAACCVFLTGCTLKDGVEYGEQCQDGDDGPDYVVFAGSTCSRAEIDDPNNAACHGFYDAVRVGFCPKNYLCVKENGVRACSITGCMHDEHEYNGGCEDDSVYHCGQHRYSCLDNHAGWRDGECRETSSGDYCYVTKCEEGYLLVPSEGRCLGLIECGAQEHIYGTQCELDSVENCGRHDNSCKSIPGWGQGTCSEGKCVIAECADGYELREGICQATLQCDGGHVFEGQCEADTLENCGMHGFACAALDGWVAGECRNARCDASSCAEGYENINGTCRARVIRCTSQQHVFDNGCEDDSLAHCGRHNFACTALAGWGSGSCDGGQCVASDCAQGYVLSNGVCMALLCGAGEHEYNSQCEPDSIAHCGIHGRDCAALAGWQDGGCDAAQCVARACDEGYDLADGICYARNLTCDANAHIYWGECEADSVENCGMHGNRCDALAGWGGGNCTAQGCVATSCTGQYKLQDGVCVALRCSEAQHVYGNGCEADSVENCGVHGNRCDALVGWDGGDCSQKACAPTKCKTGYHLWEGKCVADTQSACGATLEACGPAQVCSDGTCRDNCGAGQIRCASDGGVLCVDPRASQDFCGADATCQNGAKCGDKQRCMAGVCVAIACDENEYLYNGKCYPNSKENCGGYGKACPDNASCNDGSCVCNNEFLECDGECVDALLDVYNCGYCGYSCDAHAPSHAHVTECSGRCRYSCDANYYDLGDNEYNPNCISSDVLNALHMNQYGDCLDGYDDLDGSIENGCEADITQDTCCSARCIDCTSRLPGSDTYECYYHGGQGSNDYRCRYYCILTYSDIDGIWWNGCEYDELDNE